MNEWPVPATRTFEAAATSCCSSASVLGLSIAVGWATTLPDQLRHSGKISAP
jgi:hypothetical protein